MSNATMNAFSALKNYARAEGVTTDLADELYRALEELLRETSQESVCVANEYMAYLDWLEESPGY